MVLRLPHALKEELRVLARDNKRSMTREIEFLIEQRVSRSRSSEGVNTQC